MKSTPQHLSPASLLRSPVRVVIAFVALALASTGLCRSEPAPEAGRSSLDVLGFDPVHGSVVVRYSDPRTAPGAGEPGAEIYSLALDAPSDLEALGATRDRRLLERLVALEEVPAFEMVLQVERSRVGMNLFMPEEDVYSVDVRVQVAGHVGEVALEAYCSSRVEVGRLHTIPERDEMVAVLTWAGGSRDCGLKEMPLVLSRAEGSSKDGGSKDGGSEDGGFEDAGDVEARRLLQWPPPPPKPKPGDEILPPVRDYTPQPPYTQEARKARIQGIVIVQVLIDPEGNVWETEILKGLPMGLNQTTLETVRRWKFQPARLNGIPVTSYYNVTVTFRLE